MAKPTGYKPCENCGLPARIYQHRDERTRFCSRACADPYRAMMAGKKSREKAKAKRELIKQPKSYRLVQLTRGSFAKVSIQDFDLGLMNWAMTDSGYARRTVNCGREKKNERLHRVVMARKLGRPLRASEQVDHVNRDRLDNRRENLRLATFSTNGMNSVRRTSLYRGVARNHERFSSKITVDKEWFYCGTFDTADEAAYVYDQWAMLLHGQFAMLNFEY